MRRILILVLLVPIYSYPAFSASKVDPKLYGAPEGQVCIKCHELKTPGLLKLWRSGKMGQAGVNCYDCHKAEKKTDKTPGDPDGYDHRGFWIATLVSPKDCSRCHKEQFDQQQVSHHAKAADILNSSDNYLGTVVGGPAAVNSGCRQCHGSNIKVLQDGKLDPSTWPNTGIGRINPDGSKGSCSACHTRHRFSKEQARRPDACGKCHLGPDHPQIEVFNESKHGILYQAFRDKMNMDKGEWIVGVDYQDTATCSSCHIRATPNQSATHDVGERISWTLRPVISKKLEHWKDRREKMKDVCRQCHGDFMVDDFYNQFDSFVGSVQQQVRHTGNECSPKVDGHGETYQGRFRRQAGLDLLRTLAPRGPPRPTRRCHDGAGLCMVAWDCMRWQRTSTRIFCLKLRRSWAERKRLCPSSTSMSSRTRFIAGIRMG